MNFFSLFKRNLIYKFKKKFSIDNDDVNSNSLDELFYHYGSDKADFFKEKGNKGHGYSKFYKQKLERLKKKKILSYKHHLNKGFETFRLKKIDSLINFAIENEMTPGAQILIAKQRSVIYNKSYGFHTYDKNIKVKNTDIYDLASLTKILVEVIVSIMFG